MKAPDKIWINTDTLNGYYMSNHPLDGEEYIRKDALLEWLEYERDWFSGTDIEPHYRKVIDKLNRM